MRFYRGFIIDFNANTSASNEYPLLKLGDNPRDRRFVNKLDWLSNDEIYAIRVCLARLILNCILDPSKINEFKQGKYDLAIATYEINESEIYSADGEVLEEYKPDRNQYIAKHSITPELIKITSAADMSKIKNLLENKNMGGFIASLLLSFENNTAIRIPWGSLYARLDNMSFIEALSYLIRKYYPEVFHDLYLQEVLAESLFGSTISLGERARELDFKVELHSK